MWLTGLCTKIVIVFGQMLNLILCFRADCSDLEAIVINSSEV